jgi:putative ABC transport system permease protein
MGTNQIMVVPGQRFGPGSGGAPSFQISDVEAIRDQIPAAAGVAPVATKTVTAVFGANNWSTVAQGSNDDHFEVGNWTLAAGRTFTEAEARAGKPVCVLGETVRAKLFGRESPVGSNVRIKGFACDVIGLLRAKGQAAMGHDQDDVVVMPIATVQRRLSGNHDVGRIMVSVQRGVSIDGVKEQLSALLRERRRIGAGEEDDFRVMDTRQLGEMLTGTTKILTTLLAAVAAVSLLVGGIGIMNIMLVSVTERTREIGIRPAIGALEREVLMQFLVEAIVLSRLGGNVLSVADIKGPVPR